MSVGISRRSVLKGYAAGVMGAALVIAFTSGVDAGKGMTKCIKG